MYVIPILKLIFLPFSTPSFIKKVLTDEFSKSCSVYKTIILYIIFFIIERLVHPNHKILYKYIFVFSNTDIHKYM